MTSHTFPVSGCAGGPPGLLRSRYGRTAFCRVCAYALARVMVLENRSDTSYGNVTVPPGARRDAWSTGSHMLLISSFTDTVHELLFEIAGPSPVPL